MREILFRGKAVDSGEWVFGYYAELPEGDIGATLMTGTDELLCEDTAAYIISIETKQCPSFSPAYPIQVFDVDLCKVHRETVGQYTGLTDKNGKKIFERDIVNYTGMPKIYMIDFDEEFLHYSFFYYDKELKIIRCAGFVNKTDGKSIEVIGNIHDNPELLKVEK